MNKHPHFDLYCREHNVRIGGCRCPGPDKLKQTTDCPGDSCPGNVDPTSPQEEREEPPFVEPEIVPLSDGTEMAFPHRVNICADLPSPLTKKTTTLAQEGDAPDCLDRAEDENGQGLKPVMSEIIAGGNWPPRWDALGEPPDWWARHPWYGECDGFRKDGGCAECEYVIGALFRALITTEKTTPLAQEGDALDCLDRAEPERPTALCTDAAFGGYQNQVSMNPPTTLNLRSPVGVDLCLASEIAGLWARGIRTLSSCCGHDRTDSYIGVDPKDSEAMTALGYRRDEGNTEITAFTAKSGCAVALGQDEPVALVTLVQEVDGHSYDLQWTISGADLPPGDYRLYTRPQPPESEGFEGYVDNEGNADRDRASVEPREEK